MKTFVMCMSALFLLFSFMAFFNEAVDKAIWWAIIAGFWLSISALKDDK